MECREKLSTANYVGKKRYQAEKAGNPNKFRDDIDKFRKSNGLKPEYKAGGRCEGGGLVKC